MTHFVPSAWIEWFPTSFLGQSLLPLWIISWPPSLPLRHRYQLSPRLPSQDFSGMFLLSLITAGLFNFMLLRVGVPSYLYFQELELDIEMEIHTHRHTHKNHVEGSLLYRILLFSVKPQHESAISIHISPPFQNSLPPPSSAHPSRLIQSPCLSFLSHTANSHGLSILHMVM